MDEQELWDQYRRRQREIRQQIANLQDEEAKLFRSTLQRIQDLNPPTHPVGSEFAGALGYPAQATKETESHHPMESEDDSETRIARSHYLPPNCT